MKRWDKIKAIEPGSGMIMPRLTISKETLIADYFEIPQHNYIGKVIKAVEGVIQFEDAFGSRFGDKIKPGDYFHTIGVQV